MTNSLIDDKPAKGPIRILCDEIGFAFDDKLETTEMLLAFVSVLAGHVDSMRYIKSYCVKLGGEAVSDESAKVLEMVAAVLATNDFDSLKDKCADIHNYIHTVAPDDAYPCDHLIDMLSSCVSAVRFGIEKRCHSRHAADAAQHVWKQLYGISLFDSHTPAWEKEWARAQLQTAILSRLA